MTIREDASIIMKAALQSAQPDVAVAKALSLLPENAGKTVLVACGKAA